LQFDGRVPLGFEEVDAGCYCEVETIPFLLSQSFKIDGEGVLGRRREGDIGCTDPTAPVPNVISKIFAPMTDRKLVRTLLRSERGREPSMQ
jgi:hypothetical protein